MLGNEYQISDDKSFKKRRPNIHSLQTLDERPIDSDKGFTGKQKAAMLLASLDSATAAELVKGVDPKAVHELAEELRQLDAAGLSSEKQGLKFAQQFCDSLQPNQDSQISGFFEEVMKKSLGAEQTEQIHSGVQEELINSDPFDSLYLADPETIATILGNEHPQTAAKVLLKMPKEKVSKVLNLFDWGIRISIASRMCNCELSSIQVYTKKQKAEVEEVEKPEVVDRQPEDNTVGKASSSLLSDQSKHSTRKLSVTLRNLVRGIRDSLFGILRTKDKQTGRMVSDLMIFWEDILQISNRSLQKALMKIDIKKLALALERADNQLVKKIQSNITKPMAAALNEQMLLFSAYDLEEIEQAREEIVDVLREMNEKGGLSFIEE